MNHEHLMKHTIRQMERERKSAYQHKEEKNTSRFSGNYFLKSLINLTSKMINKGE
ncbi:hypothetical protein RCG17_07525 [Neobacillus sp. PS3-12]|jgi:hypothetical protein|uniref:hypothetical protein n=1 Tax=Neobacillus sp. PS3-12 TaxID=3070677 RepID=UPI0027E04FFF|nr:hypothetical protein [Neobacillus sp. PS3-12]WML54454.1 hypothetical protein RCG17_07525 [Neobacillus sp. PS3-12]